VLRNYATAIALTLLACGANSVEKSTPLKKVPTSVDVVSMPPPQPVDVKIISMPAMPAPQVRVVVPTDESAQSLVKVTWWLVGCQRQSDYRLIPAV
jgi:hypothetical protein